MKEKRLIYLFCILLTLLPSLHSCTTSGSNDATRGESIAMRHSELLRLTKCDGYITAEIINPWDTTKLLHRYILVPKDDELPASLPKGDVVRTPLRKTVICTSVHCSLISELGAYGSIAGVYDADYIYLPRLKADVKGGKVKDLGNSMEPNIEKLIDLSPDAILLSPFEGSGSYGKLGKLGIPIIECADYMEASALGRAEWMRFFGLLYGTRQTSDSLFASVEKDYTQLRDTVATTKERPTVITEMKSGSAWYVAGGNSYVGRLLKDAGADYIFNEEKVAGAVPYDPEVVFDRGQKAHYWLVKYSQPTPLTYGEMATAWAANSTMEAFRNKHVYGVNLSEGRFYEETPFHPNLLLRDLVYIFHPEILKDYTPRYYMGVR